MSNGKRRGLCPSCSAKRAVLFAEHLQEHVLLPYPHRHLTFTIPKRLRVYFRYDRRLLAELYRAAWKCYSEYVAELLPGASTGCVMALHTAGETLNWHPHIHAIGLSGGIDRNGSFLPLPELDTELLTTRFRREVFDFLLRHELIDAGTVDNMLSWEHSGFSVHAAEEITAEDENAPLFLARYLKKCPLSLERLSIEDTGLEPSIRYKTDDGSEQSFSPLEFLARLSQHIPRVFEQTTRYMGVYSARSRGAKRAEVRFRAILCHGEAPPPPVRPSASWARAIKRVYEVDPLLCERCGAAMKIIAFIHDPRGIEAIAKNLGYPSWRAPPAFGSSSREAWTDCSPEFDQRTF